MITAQIYTDLATAISLLSGILAALEAQYPCCFNCGRRIYKDPTWCESCGMNQVTREEEDR